MRTVITGKLSPSLERKLVILGWQENGGVTFPLKLVRCPSLCFCCCLDGCAVSSLRAPQGQANHCCISRRMSHTAGNLIGSLPLCCFSFL